jgi:hypothetical protein
MPQQIAGTTAQGGADDALQAIVQRRSELSSQLTSLTIRRDLLSQQLRNTDAAGQARIKAMLADVATQTERVIKDMSATDEAANKLTANAAYVGTLTQAGGGGAGTTTGQSAAGELAERITVLGAGALMAILLVAFARWLWRPKRPAATGLGEADVSRMEKLQQSIDVIAVEVERISESQRHLTKVLADRALGAGEAKEVAVNRDRQAEQVKR